MTIWQLAMRMGVADSVDAGLRFSVLGVAGDVKVNLIDGKYFAMVTSVEAGTQYGGYTNEQLTTTSLRVPLQTEIPFGATRLSAVLALSPLVGYYWKRPLHEDTAVHRKKERILYGADAFFGLDIAFARQMGLRLGFNALQLTPHVFGMGFGVQFKAISMVAKNES